jgi:Tfp pilus assembly protein PilF
MSGDRTSQMTEVQRAVRCLGERKWSDAIEFARRATAIEPADGFAHMVLGVALTGTRQFDAALPALEHATRLAPADPRTHYNFAVSLQQSGRESQAMVAYRACLALDPDHADALWNYGESLRLHEHFGLGLQMFDRLLEIERKKRPHAAHRMAVCCAYLGLAGRAAALFQEALAATDDPVTHWEYALFLLKAQRFDDAWRHYARRFEAGARIQLRGVPLPGERWDGQFEAGATLMVAGEQGAGDELLFAAFVPALVERARDAGMHVILVCCPELVRLFRASFPRVQVEPAPTAHETGGGQAARLQALVARRGPVWVAHAGDLPRWIPKPEPRAYLVPDRGDLDAARALIGVPAPGVAQPDDRPLRVGLVWSSNPTVAQFNRAARNVPSILVNEWLAGLPDVRFYALMPREHVDRVGEAAAVALTDLSNFVTDFSRTAAAIQCMDAVISVCTSTANLAGALGADLHVLLQHHADWRWAGTNAWFARVQRHRQERRGDWSPCMASLVQALQKMTASRAR